MTVRFDPTKEVPSLELCKRPVYKIKYYLELVIYNGKSAWVTDERCEVEHVGDEYVFEGFEKEGHNGSR